MVVDMGSGDDGRWGVREAEKIGKEINFLELLLFLFKKYKNIVLCLLNGTGVQAEGPNLAKFESFKDAIEPKTGTRVAAK